MNKIEMLNFIFSKTEWKNHFIDCSLKLNKKEWCHCAGNYQKSFDNENKIATCLHCKLEVKDWYPKNITSQVNISDVILNEEQKFFKLLEEKEPLLIKLKDNLTGEALSWIHQTHGLDCDMIEDILSIKLSRQQRDEYKKYYDIHRQTGLKGFVPEIIGM